MSKSTYLLDPEASYLIAGGLGGIGRSMARWLVDRGARHLILLSRSGPKSAAAQKLLLELGEKGATVQTPRADISDEQSLRCALTTCATTMPPVKGCIQSCMVITVRQPRIFPTGQVTKQTSKLRKAYSRRCHSVAGRAVLTPRSRVPGIYTVCSQETLTSSL